jgi:acyl-CoA reductase-like NAD-dependent aldehyde dehydrogenase
LKESGARSTMTRELTTINPATEEVISTYEIMTKEQINGKAKKAQKAFSEWKKDIQKREHHIHDFAQELRKNKEELARKITQEMGKAIKEARSEFSVDNNSQTLIRQIIIRILDGVLLLCVILQYLPMHANA